MLRSGVVQCLWNKKSLLWYLGTFRFFFLTLEVGMGWSLLAMTFNTSDWGMNNINIACPLFVYPPLSFALALETKVRWKTYLIRACGIPDIVKESIPWKRWLLDRACIHAECIILKSWIWRVSLTCASQPAAFMPSCVLRAACFSRTAKWTNVEIQITMFPHSLLLQSLSFPLFCLLSDQDVLRLSGWKKGGDSHLRTQCWT